MEILPEQPDLPLRSLAVAQAGVAPDRIPAVQSGQGLSTGPRPALSLVGGSQLLLAEPAEPVPQDWRDALTRLAAWLELDVQHVSARPSGALRQVAARGMGASQSASTAQAAGWGDISITSSVLALSGLPVP